ncbi:recombinase family protein [Actinomadura harenae]|uniref:recombinase family protein n=1 Tax=Actinomadura harenae TaxID=2483351 RepID=UPI001F2B24C1|nr:recombinase family protein [Actinomadura harenae]
MGCIRIFADQQSGKNADRDELIKAMDYLRPGDTPVVPSLDRLVLIKGACSREAGSP